MHREIATEIVIDAPARIVWDILVDFARYREWNPYIPSLAGTARTGERVRFVFRLVPGVPVPACARVLDFVPPRELRWGGGVGGLLRAEHYMILEPLSESRVRFRHGEIFTGLLVPVAWRVALARYGPAAYGNTNAALKRRAESISMERA